jgi:hypothetical protein
VKKHRTCCYTETDPEGKAEYKLGETELEKHERLLAYQIKKVAKLKEKQQRAANRVTNELSLSTDNNKILDVNKNIIFTHDKSSNTVIDTSNKKIVTTAKPSTPVLTIPISSSKHTSNPSSTDTTTKKKYCSQPVDINSSE